MKVVLIFDQGLAGAGGKSNPHQKLEIAKGIIGSGLMLKPHFDKFDIEIVATLYCGNEYFLENQDQVVTLMTKMVEKIKPDFVICGPCFDFKDYALMCSMISKNINDNTDYRAIVTMAEDKNKETIEKYKDEIDILKMPKKGGTGLNASFDRLAEYVYKKHNNQETTDLKDYIY